MECWKKVQQAWQALSRREKKGKRRKVPGTDNRNGSWHEWHYRLSRLYLRRRPDVERSGSDGRGDRERRLMREDATRAVARREGLLPDRGTDGTRRRRGKWGRAVEAPWFFRARRNAARQPQ